MRMFKVNNDVTIDLDELSHIDTVHFKDTFKRGLVFGMKNGIKLLVQFEEGKLLTKCRNKVEELCYVVNPGGVIL